MFSGLEDLANRCRNLTVVTNDVFSGGQDYDDDTIRYLKTLARINRRLAAKADLVAEVICGLPDVWKGALP